MPKALPERVDPLRLADQGARLDGARAIGDLGRLVAALASDTGVAAVTLEFGRDDENRAWVRGSVTALLTFTCQRCLEPVALDVNTTFLLAVVRNEEEARRLPDRYDPLVLDDRSLALDTLVEDELLLALPLVPMHTTLAECGAAARAVLAAEDAGETGGRGGPFAVLAKLKHD